MKTYLTLTILLCSLGVFGQVIETSAGKVDLQRSPHKEGYLQSKTDADDRTKIIWYTEYQMYRECGSFNELKTVPAGYEHKDELCDCAETFSGRLGPASATLGANTILFEFDSSILEVTSYPLLDQLVASLKSTGEVIELDGFASSEGLAAHNLRLSRDRANSVKTYLVNSGISAAKIKVKAYGETHPIADNANEAGRVANRRVEIKGVDLTMPL